MPEYKNILEWSKAYKIMPRDHIKSHKYTNCIPFIPSYQFDPNPPDIRSLLCMEYSRICLLERECFIKCRKELEKKKKLKKPEFKSISKPESNQKRFIMNKFRNIPAKTCHTRKNENCKTPKVDLRSRHCGQMVPPFGTKCC